MKMVKIDELLNSSTKEELIFMLKDLINEYEELEEKILFKYVKLEEDEEISAELIDHLSNNNNIWIEAVNNLQSTNHSEVKLEHDITTILKQVGIPAHLKGYMYLRTAILMVYSDIELLGQITKRLYPNIARQYSTTASRVEKAIRHAIENSWNQGDKRKINTIIRAATDSIKGKPTNSEFIALIADKLKIKNRYAFESR